MNDREGFEFKESDEDELKSRQFVPSSSLGRASILSRFEASDLSVQSADVLHYADVPHYKTFDEEFWDEDLRPGQEPISRHFLTSGGGTNPSSNAKTDKLNNILGNAMLFVGKMSKKEMQRFLHDVIGFNPENAEIREEVAMDMVRMQKTLAHNTQGHRDEESVVANHPRGGGVQAVRLQSCRGRDGSRTATRRAKEKMQEMGKRMRARTFRAPLYRGSCLLHPLCCDRRVVVLTNGRSDLDTAPAWLAEAPIIGLPKGTGVPST